MPEALKKPSVEELEAEDQAALEAIENRSDNPIAALEAIKRRQDLIFDLVGARAEGLETRRSSSRSTSELLRKQIPVRRAELEKAQLDRLRAETRETEALKVLNETISELHLTLEDFDAAGRELTRLLLPENVIAAIDRSRSNHLPI